MTQKREPENVYIRRMMRIIGPWGGRIHVYDNRFRLADKMYSLGKVEYYTFSEHLGIRWDTKTVLLYKSFDNTRGAYDVAHEIAHLFATKDKPDVCDEHDFLYWELCLLRQVGLTFEGWRMCNPHWTVREHEGTFRPELTVIRATQVWDVRNPGGSKHIYRELLEDVVHKSYKRCKRAGIVQNGKPLSVWSEHEQRSSKQGHPGSRERMVRLHDV